jgi:IS5 family transposase
MHVTNLFSSAGYALSDPAAEEALYDIESMRDFAGLEFVVDAIPDETTILNFRRLIEKHELSLMLFEEINTYLVDKGIQVSQGSMIDATIVQAPLSTKNKEKKRDPEMHSTKNNNQHYFGMKIHIGTDINSNVIHTATVTADITEMPHLLRPDDKIVFGDPAMSVIATNEGQEHWGMTLKINDKRKPNKQLSSSQKKRNRKNSRVRGRVEHCFSGVKWQSSYPKVRY